MSDDEGLTQEEIDAMIELTILIAVGCFKVGEFVYEKLTEAMENHSPAALTDATDNQKFWYRASYRSWYEKDGLADVLQHVMQKCGEATRSSAPAQQCPRQDAKKKATLSKKYGGMRRSIATEYALHTAFSDHEWLKWKHIDALKGIKQKVGDDEQTKLFRMGMNALILLQEIGINGYDGKTQAPFVIKRLTDSAESCQRLENLQGLEKSFFGSNDGVKKYGDITGTNGLSPKDKKTVKGLKVNIDRVRYRYKPGVTKPQPKQEQEIAVSARMFDAYDADYGMYSMYDGVGAADVVVSDPSALPGGHDGGLQAMYMMFGLVTVGGCVGGLCFCFVMSMVLGAVLRVAVKKFKRGYP